MTYPFAIVLLLLTSAFFSACETSFISLSDAQIQAYKKHHKIRGRILTFFIANTSQLLNTILIGNNAANVLISVLTTRFALGALESKSLAVISGIILLVLLLLGEIIPKQIAIENNMLIVIIGLYPLFFFYYLIFPFSYLLDLVTRGIKKLFKPKNEFSRSQDQLLHMFYHSSSSGVISHSTAKMLSGVLHLHTLTAERIMTHRTKITKLSSNATVASLNSIAPELVHSRYPLYEPSDPEYITGVINTNTFTWAKEAQKPLSYYQEEAYFTSEKQKIAELLPLFLQKHIHLAIVLDEFGGLAGVITLFDIVEFLFAPTPGVFKNYSSQSQLPSATNNNKNALHTPAATRSPGAIETTIDATTDLSHIVALTESRPPTHTHTSTIGGYIQEELGRLPVENEIVTTTLGEFKIVKVAHNRIEQVVWIHSSQ